MNNKRVIEIWRTMVNSMSIVKTILDPCLILSATLSFFVMVCQNGCD
jgi:hypothetical protein